MVNGVGCEHWNWQAYAGRCGIYFGGAGVVGLMYVCVVCGRKSVVVWERGDRVTCA